MGEDVVASTIVLQGIEKAAIGGCRCRVGEGGHLVGVGDAIVVGDKNLGESVDKCLPAVGDNRCGGIHHHFDGLIEGTVLGTVAEQAIALLEEVVVADEGIEVGGVALRDNHVGKSATLLAALGDERQVGRGYHHCRQQADMSG